MGSVRFIYRTGSYAIGGNWVMRKTGINQLNEKRSLMPWGLKVPI